MFQRLSVAAGVLCLSAAWLPAAAQAVYKCGAHSYSQAPCSRRAVDTTDAPVPVRRVASDWDVRRIEHNRVMAQSMHRLPGETDTEFALRRKRAALLDTDREECARLDAKIPFETERARSVSVNESQAARISLTRAKARYSALRC